MRWARAVALAMLMCSVIGVAILHGLRTDLSPVGNRLSEYANGSHGWLMALVFGSLGVGLISLGVAFRATMRSDRHLITVLIPAAAFVAGIAAIVSGIFRTGVSATSEVIHSRASALATCSHRGARTRILMAGHAETAGRRPGPRGNGAGREPRPAWPCSARCCTRPAGPASASDCCGPCCSHGCCGPPGTFRPIGKRLSHENPDEAVRDR